VMHVTRTSAFVSPKTPGSLGKGLLADVMITAILGPTEVSGETGPRGRTARRSLAHTARHSPSPLAKDQQIRQRIFPKPVRSMQSGAALPSRKKAQIEGC
jgi:hypothetical protein